ncbi:unnamed protein product [Callosobruchus maculatus]|uniref:C2H2-type domain-containing protein n=3 Tax=Callosobruchus maculatus TaxID=64391 RepID=A0A653DI34_CALMS|nr:unnamed protein product [Callosobruchus maculatus]
MDESKSSEGGIRLRSRLAVFEHITEENKPKKRKFGSSRYNDSDDSSPSESELVIDETPTVVKKKHKKKPSIKISEEVLNLKCEWISCDSIFKSWIELNDHLLNHAGANSGTMCLWTNCNTDCKTVPFLMQHVSYHGYLTKLKNIGSNVLTRESLPECKHEKSEKIILRKEGYMCEWEYCMLNFYNVCEFYMHMEMHVNANPREANEKKNEIILCDWAGCKLKFATKYKLAEHLRTHTHEKVMACPTCGTLFANRTKFVDHRKRQLSEHLQSYQCSQCLKLFPTERLLREHTRSHINHYKCQMCNMTCATPSRLAEHIRFRHLDMKPYKCDQCDKAFKTKYNLATHIKTHGEDAESCEFCSYKCRSKVGMQSHYKKKHDQSAPIFECHTCKKKLKRGQFLTKHLMKIHNYHWPSGHSRFRYRKDQDGIYRLQTVRYESLEVTEEMIRSESMQKSDDASFASGDKRDYCISVTCSNETFESGEDNILIMITDVDEQGNVIQTKMVESGMVVEEKILIKSQVVGLPNLGDSDDELPT